MVSNTTSSGGGGPNLLFSPREGFLGYDETLSESRGTKIIKELWLLDHGSVCEAVQLFNDDPIIHRRTFKNRSKRVRNGIEFR